MRVPEVGYAPRHGSVGRDAERRRETKPAGGFGRSTTVVRPSLGNVLDVILRCVLSE